MIEILIALAVFAILATLTSSAIYHAFNTRARVTRQADRLSALQLAIVILNRDTQQMVNRSVRRSALHLVPAFIGKPHHLEFTRGGHANPKGQEARSNLTRVAFLCGKSQLIRRRWDTLDGPRPHPYQDKILLDGLTTCQFAYLAQNLEVYPDWTEHALQPEQDEPTRPLAVQLSANVAGWGTMSLLFKLDGGIDGT